MRKKINPWVRALAGASLAIFIFPFFYSPAVYASQKPVCTLVSSSGGRYTPNGAGFDIECDKSEEGRTIGLQWSCTYPDSQTNTWKTVTRGASYLCQTDCCKPGAPPCPRSDQQCLGCKCVNTCEQLGYPAKAPLKNQCGNRFDVTGTTAKDSGVAAKEGEPCAINPGPSQFSTIGSCYWKTSGGLFGGKRGACMKDLGAGTGTCEQVQVAVKGSGGTCPALACTPQTQHVTAACKPDDCGVCADPKKSQCTPDLKDPKAPNKDCIKLANALGQNWPDKSCTSCMCNGCRTTCSLGQKLDNLCLCQIACGDGQVDAGEQCGEPGLGCSTGETCNSQTCLCLGQQQTTVSVQIQVTTSTAASGKATSGSFAVKALVTTTTTSTSAAAGSSGAGSSGGSQGT